MTSLDVLASKIDEMNAIQKEQREDIKTLTNAVTTLVTNTASFEKMRAEDHKRMDKLESRIDHLADVVGKLSGQICEGKPIREFVKYGIMVGIAALVSALIAAI